MAVFLVAENSRARSFVTLKRFSEGTGGFTLPTVAHLPIYQLLTRRFGGNTKEYKEYLIRNKNKRDSEKKKMTGKKCRADGEAPGLSAFSLMTTDCLLWHLMTLLCHPRDWQRSVLDCKWSLFSPLYSQAV